METYVCGSCGHHWSGSAWSGAVYRANARTIERLREELRYAGALQAAQGNQPFVEAVDSIVDTVPGSRPGWQRCPHCHAIEHVGATPRGRRKHLELEDAEQVAVVAERARDASEAEALLDRLQDVWNVPGTSRVEWATTGQQLGAVFRDAEGVKDRASWEIGWWALWALKRYIGAEDMYGEMCRITGLAKQTLKNIVRVARAFERGATVPGASFTHHAEVARKYLSPQRRKLLLEEANENRWSTARLREEVKKLAPSKPDGDAQEQRVNGALQRVDRGLLALEREFGGTSAANDFARIRAVLRRVVKRLNTDSLQERQAS